MGKETESLWFPAGQQTCTLPSEMAGASGCGLVGISEFYADNVLNEIQSLSATTWTEWKSAYPDTKYVREQDSNLIRKPLFSIQQVFAHFGHFTPFAQ